MNRYIIILLLIIGLFCSCQNKKTGKSRSSHKISRAYKPKDNSLKNLDSLIALNKKYILDSLYNAYHNADAKSQIYLYSKLIRKYTFNYNLKKAGILVKYLDSLSDYSSGLDSLLRAEYYSAKGVYFSYSYKLDSAILYIHKAIKIYNNTVPKICKELLFCYNDIGVAHFYFGGNIDSTIYYLKKQEKLFDSTLMDHKLMYINYYIQANVYKKIHNYSLSLTYVDLAIKELKEYSIPDSNAISFAYSLKGDIEYQYELLNKAFKDDKTAISFMKNQNLKSKRHLYLGIINVLSALDSIDLCYRYIDTLYRIDQRDTGTMALTYKLKATIEANNKKPIEAKKDFEKAIELYKNSKRNSTHLYAETCLFYSRVLKDLKLFQESINYAKKAVFLQFDTKVISFETLSKEPSSIYYLAGLAGSYAEKYRFGNNKSDRKTVFRLYNLIDSLISYLYNNFDGDVIISNQANLDYYYNDKLNFYYDIYSKEKVNLNEIVKVFNDYKSKTLLQERMLNNSKLETNDSIIALKRKVEEIKYKIEIKKGNKDSLNFVLNKILVKLNNFCKRNPLVKLDENQNLLKKLENYCSENNTMVLDYFIPDNVGLRDIGYIFVSNGILSHIVQIRDVKELKYQSDSLYYLYSTYSKDTFRIDKLESTLYDKLLGVVSTYSTTSTKSLIIIPDRYLYEIPFELLSSSDDKMILNRFNVAYGYSIKNLLLANKKHKPQKRILAFAHSNKETILGDTNCKLQEIPGSYLESEAIKKIFDNDSKIFTGYNATKDNFIKYANSFPIIHLALHGESDQFSRFKSKIYFRDNDTITELYPHELMKHGISPDLLVLSACESARGKLIGHESMFSIARAFYASGTKNVISSLWSLDDEASKNILTNFYKKIKENPYTGYPKALRESKLIFLKNNNNNPIKKSLVGSLVLYN